MPELATSSQATASLQLANQMPDMNGKFILVSTHISSGALV